MTALYANNVAGTLAVAVGPTDTTLLLGAGQGASFPSFAAGDYCYATLINNSTYAVEIVKITARSTDSLTVVRGRDNTAAQSFPIGTVLELRLCAVMMAEVDYRRVAGLANGVATLDASGTIPDGQLAAAIARAANVVPLSQKGVASGVATLDTNTLVPDAQLSPNIARTANVIPNSLKAAANGVATLDAATKVPVAQIPDLSATYATKANANTLAALLTLNAGLTVAAGNTSLQATTATTLVASTSVSSPSYFSAGATVELATTGAGTVYLRPNGAGSATNQASLASTGVLTCVDLTTTSDRRRKKLIRAASPHEHLADKLKLRSFAWRSDGRSGRGVIAQQVADVAPDYVHAGPDGYLSIDKAGLALEAVIGLAARVRHLEGSKTCSSPRNSSKRTSRSSAAPSSSATKSRRSSR